MVEMPSDVEQMSSRCRANVEQMSSKCRANVGQMSRKCFRWLKSLRGVFCNVFVLSVVPAASNRKKAENAHHHSHLQITTFIGNSRAAPVLAAGRVTGAGG